MQTRTSCLEQGRVAPYAVGSSDELCDRLMPNSTTRTTSWTTSTSSSTTEENSEITGRKSWIAKAGTYNQLEMTGHGNDNEGNQQPVHQDNSLPECLPELIPEELCCHPCPPTLPISSSYCYDGYSSNHDLAKNARKNFMVAQPRTGDQQVDGVTLAARPYTEDRQVEGVAGSATNTPYQYIYIYMSGRLRAIRWNRRPCQRGKLWTC